MFEAALMSIGPLPSCSTIGRFSKNPIATFCGKFFFFGYAYCGLERVETPASRLRPPQKMGETVSCTSHLSDRHSHNCSIRRRKIRVIATANFSGGACNADYSVRLRELGKDLLVGRLIHVGLKCQNNPGFHISGTRQQHLLHLSQKCAIT